MKRVNVVVVSHSTHRPLAVAQLDALSGMITDRFAHIRQSAPPAEIEKQISAMEGALLQWLVRFTNARSVLEIGTFMGYSGAWLAAGLPSGGKLLSIEKSREYHVQALVNLATLEFDIANKIELRCADALDVMPELVNAGTKFDVVFIDANKLGYPAYVRWADRLLQPGGLLIMDDVLLYAGRNEVRITKMAAAIDEARNAIFRDACYDPMILPMCHGLLLAKKIA
ncbi:MAG: class I SAM-dependent methyltransferase [Proteobacteria bacterium]|nr:class I SAM-dependent methyltransferase [Pseudomonadota bacterium]